MLLYADSETAGQRMKSHSEMNGKRNRMKFTKKPIHQLAKDIRSTVERTSASLKASHVPTTSSTTSIVKNNIKNKASTKRKNPCEENDHIYPN